MPHRRITNADEDIEAVLRAALDMGLTVRIDRPTTRPEPEFITFENLSDASGGVFSLSRPEWIFGPPQIMQIESGYNKGKYIQSPRINVAEIGLDLSSERIDGNNRRLGSGGISWYRDWLRKPEHIMQASPADVEKAYNELIKRIDTRKRIRGGKQTYTVLSAAWRKLNEGSVLPPYYYINWPN